MHGNNVPIGTEDKKKVKGRNKPEPRAGHGSSACGGGRRGPGVGHRGPGVGGRVRGTGGVAGGGNPRRAGQPDDVGERRQRLDSLTSVCPPIYTWDYL